jgi:hypothetical protein
MRGTQDVPALHCIARWSPTSFHFSARHAPARLLPGRRHRLSSRGVLVFLYASFSCCGSGCCRANGPRSSRRKACTVRVGPIPSPGRSRSASSRQCSSACQRDDGTGVAGGAPNAADRSGPSQRRGVHLLRRTHMVRGRVCSLGIPAPIPRFATILYAVLFALAVGAQREDATESPAARARGAPR